jgi:very-short-patch-repair endonuclease
MIRKGTESPIETDFIAALIAVSDDVRVKAAKWTNLGELGWLLTRDETRRVYCVPQFPFQKFRLDFLLGAYLNPMYPRWLCVECDGQEYHSLPEHQARDAARDAELAIHSIKVMRFTGKTLRRDPFRCARKALSYVTSGRSDEDSGFEGLGPSISRVITATNERQK